MISKAECIVIYAHTPESGPLKGLRLYCDYPSPNVETAMRDFWDISEKRESLDFVMVINWETGRVIARDDRESG